MRPFMWLITGLAIASTIVSIKSARTPTSPSPVTFPVAAPQPPDVNPSVGAGLVKWHRSFEEAKQASQKSGKPVLLFHMMGQLDRQFC